MKHLAVAFIVSVLTAVYWWIVFTIVHADVLFAGDRNPARQPLPDRELLIRNGITLIAAVLIYAVVNLSWRRLTKGLHRAD